MLYGSIDRTLLTAGLHNNSNITDALVHNKLFYAQQVIDGMISDVYQLPLPVFWENTIVFSGTGSGSGTMTITIDGQDYTVDIENAMTADRAADLLRESILSVNGNIYSEPTLDDETVRIVSKVTNDKTDVVITSTDPQTVQGITATGGTPMPTAHPILREISQLMAAAQLMQIAYGKEAEGTDKDGYRMMEVAMEELRKIQTKEIKLMDGNGSEFNTSNGGRLNFYPNNSSSTGDGDEDDTTNNFKVNEQF